MDAETLQPIPNLTVSVKKNVGILGPAVEKGETDGDGYVMLRVPDDPKTASVSAPGRVQSPHGPILPGDPRYARVVGSCNEQDNGVIVLTAWAKRDADTQIFVLPDDFRGVMRLANSRPTFELPPLGTQRPPVRTHIIPIDTRPGAITQYGLIVPSEPYQSRESTIRFADGAELKRASPWSLVPGVAAWQIGHQLESPHRYCAYVYAVGTWDQATVEAERLAQEVDQVDIDHGWYPYLTEDARLRAIKRRIR